MGREKTKTNHATVEFERELHAAKRLLGAGKLVEADAEIARLVSMRPDHAEAQYAKAVVKRMLNQPDDAFDALDVLHSILPSHSRGYQEKGQLWIVKKDIKRAIEAFEAAVELDAALIISWQALIRLYEMDRNAEGLGRARAHFERLKGLPRELLNVSTLINEKQLDKAESLCRQFLLRDPKNVEGMRLLAKIGTELGITDDAETLLKSALEFEPDFHLGRFDYVNVLQKRQNFVKAFEQAELLMKAVPADYNYRRLYANTCLGVGRHEEALQLYEDVLKVDPENPQILLMCGHAAKTIGRIDDGISYYRRCYTARPDFGDAFWSLANLKTYQLTEHELKLAKEGEAADSTTLNDRIHLCFALGKAYEDREKFSLAFEYYERGNTSKKQQLGYESRFVSEEIDAQIKVCNKHLVAAKRAFGVAADDPIFIVGLPRAGSTLLEQILSSHSKVDGTFELPNVLNLVAQLNGRRMAGDAARYPAVLSELSERDVQRLGNAYIEGTRIHRSGAPFYTDKMPNNFRHIGLIKIMLPNARIIDARRSPMACCFSGFKQLFAEGQAYTYGLEEIGRYYLDYVRLMEHWDEVFPGEILRVQYEDVVEDLEVQVARILNYCGLEMETACLEFYKTDRLVQTPSSGQVRQPIYDQGLEQWKHFEAHLAPLKAALEL
jgi:tetratricopeptide (TPR) repeat protein